MQPSFEIIAFYLKSAYGRLYLGEYTFEMIGKRGVEMDLRVVKTRQLIQDSFLDLRKKKNLDKIRIGELCELCQINKSTFYRHYQDIYDLSDQMENTAIDAMFEDMKQVTFPGKDYLVRCMKVARDNGHTDRLAILFRGRMDVLEKKASDRFHDMFLRKGAPRSHEIVNAFVVQGCLHAFFDTNPDLNKISDEDIRLYSDTITSLLATLSRNKNIKEIIADNILSFFKTNL